MIFHLMLVLYDNKWYISAHNYIISQYWWLLIHLTFIYSYSYSKNTEHIQDAKEPSYYKVYYVVEILFMELYFFKVENIWKLFCELSWIKKLYWAWILLLYLLCYSVYLKIWKLSQNLMVLQFVIAHSL